MNPNEPAKRIPKSLGTDAKLVGSYTLTDVAVALFPGVVVVLFLQVLLPPTLSVGGVPVQSATLPLAGMAVATGALFVYLTPTYTTSIDWLETFVRFHRREKNVPHAAAIAATRLDCVHVEAGAIERTDGAFVGMVQVDPPSMALATDTQWGSLAEAFQDFVNTVVEFPIQIYSTTKPFPVETYLANYTDRLEDPDVKANPRLARLIEAYVEWYAADLEQRRMTIRDHYVIVTVTPEEVLFESESLLQKLARLPLLGLFVEARYAPRVAEQREAMFEAVDERCRRVEAGLRELEGCHARRVDVETATRLLAEFWAGQSIEYGSMAPVLRTRPIVGGQH